MSFATGLSLVFLAFAALALLAAALLVAIVVGFNDFAALVAVDLDDGLLSFAASLAFAVRLPAEAVLPFAVAAFLPVEDFAAVVPDEAGFFRLSAFARGYLTFQSTALSFAPHGSVTGAVVN
ncbi:MAG: hypothetical protein GC182_15765 [Rhodopseudomonas sp.]|nr:hypothetical protein [Rhodopseudomonas sp.]